MILPTSFVSGIALLIVTLLAWGSWAVTLKRAGKFRYEVYYLDFAAGFLLCSLLAAFTLGSLNSSELTFQDNFLITGYRKMAFALAAGVVFNLGNVLLSAAISAAGMALAMPLSLGVALIVTTVWNFAWNPQDNPFLTFGGVVLVIAAIVVLSFAFSSYRDMLLEAKKKALQLDPRTKQGRRLAAESSGAALGIVLSIVAGIILGFFGPVAGSATDGENGIAPYGMMVLVAAGVVFSTFFFSPFTMNFPVSGTPARVADYFKAKGSQHSMALLGGVLLSAALLSLFLVAGSPAGRETGPAWITALPNGAGILGLIWGTVWFREFQNSGERTRTLLWATAVLYAAGLVMISIAPLYRA